MEHQYLKLDNWVGHVQDEVNTCCAISPVLQVPSLGKSYANPIWTLYTFYFWGGHTP